MHLRNITLENFRCFDRLTLPLHPRLTVLVADNGGGKTSVLDGIAIGLSPLMRAFSTANQRLGDESSGGTTWLQDTDFRLLNVPKAKGGMQNRVSDFAKISLENTEGLQWDVLRRSQNENEATVPHELSTYAQCILDSIKTDWPKFMPVFAYYGATRGMIQVPERIRDSKVNYDYPTSALTGALDPQTDFKEMLKWFDQEEASELRAARDSKLFLESPALATVRAALTSLLGDEYVNPQFNEKHKFVVKAKNGPSELQVTQLSQGYQSMLALGIDFARRLALANPDLTSNFQNKKNRDELAAHLAYFVAKWSPVDEEEPLLGPSWAPAIMLVDEIDLHLHPSWQQRVLHDLMRAFPGTQFIVSTHSPQVLTTVKRENIRILTQEDDGTWSADMPDEETKGVESSTTLNDVMGVNQVPPVPEAGWRNDYTALIENGTYESDGGKELRDKLVTLYGAQHPIILDFDRLIRFQAFKRSRSI